MTTPSIVPGTILAGKFQVERVLGMGGMGMVLSALHLELDQRVAIKLMLPEYARNADVVGRFMREARAAARIKSEHVVGVTDVGRLESGEPFMVMELLTGQDLEQYLESYGPLPIVEATDYVLQVMEAVADAHAAGIVHRDLKPANMFLTRRRDGSACVKVLDFGISKVIDGTGAGTAVMKTQGMLGSPMYMSPEQLQSAEVDGRSDIWSLGVVLFQLLTGVFPFTAATLPQICTKVTVSPPASLRAYRPDVPAALEAVIFRCLEKLPQARFASVVEFAAALAPFGPVGARSSLAAIRNVTSAPTNAPAPRPWRSTIVEPSTPAAATLAPLGNTHMQAAAPTGRKKLIWAALAAVCVIVGAVSVAAISVRRRLAVASGSPATSTSALAPGYALLDGGPSEVRSAEPAALASAPAAATAPEVADAGRPSSRRPQPNANIPNTGSTIPPTPTAASHPVPAVVAAPPPNCAIPFYVDSAGIRRIRPECNK